MTGKKETRQARIHILGVTFKNIVKLLIICSTATGAGRKNRRTSREQPFPKWSDRSADWRAGGRPEVAAGIDVFGGERRQFPESTGRARRTNLQVSTLDCKCASFKRAEALMLLFKSLDRRFSSLLPSFIS